MFAGESVVETTSDKLNVTDPCDIDPTYDFVYRNFRAAFSLENSNIVVEFKDTHEIYKFPCSPPHSWHKLTFKVMNTATQTSKSV